MSEYDTWAPVYDAWSSGMPDDVAQALYDGFAREPFDDTSLEFVYVTRKR